MDETTKDQILSRIDALAEKMGTTAEYLWGVIVADVARRGIILSALGFVLLIVGALLAWRGTVSLVRGYETRAPDSGRVLVTLTPEGHSMWGAGVIMALAGVVVLIVGAGVLGSNLGDAAAPHLEAWNILVGGS